MKTKVPRRKCKAHKENEFMSKEVLESTECELSELEGLDAQKLFYNSIMRK